MKDKREQQTRTGKGWSTNKQTDNDWRDQLQTTDKGKVLSNAFNTLLIFKNDENLKDKFVFNLLTQKPEIIGKVPWERSEDIKEITDYDDSCLRNYLSINYGIRSKDIIFDAVNQIVREKKYHPIRNYLKNLVWDGQSRLDSLLVDFFDADDTDLTWWQTRLTLVGAVKRVFHPGCKFDYVLTLKGDQGSGKSTFFQKLAIKDEWFSDSLDDMRGKDGKEQILGNWIIELGEMAAVSKGDQKRIKQFITSTVDEFRPAYGRRSIRVPRQCIFVATTNDELPLKDDTGGRRWWIVDVKSKWFEKELTLEIDQIWAEAVHQYQYMEANNIPLRLPNYLEEQARKIQSDNTDKGLYAGIIEEVLERGYVEEYDAVAGVTKQVPINETCAFHVWVKVLGRYKDQFNSAHARDINATLKSLDGWEQVGRVKFGEYGKQTVYQRKDS